MWEESEGKVKFYKPDDDIYFVLSLLTNWWHSWNEYSNSLEVLSAGYYVVALNFTMLICE